MQAQQKISEFTSLILPATREEQVTKRQTIKKHY
jgi:hypothetical protein